MGKVVRTVAKIAAVAAIVVATGGAAAGLAIFGTTAGVTAFGLSIGSLMTIAAVSSAVGAMFAKKPGGLANSNRERLYATINPDTPRKQVFGRTAMATDVRYHECTGTDQEYYWQVIALASHAVEAIEELWMDDKLAWSSGGGVTADFSGYLTVWAVAEGSAANITSISSTWGPASNRRLTGIAHLDLRFKTTGNSKKTQSPFASSIPSRVTVVGKGRKVYDPRLDSTAGGSGAHRAANQATWQYANGATVLGNNCALVLLNYLIGWKIAGRLAVGKGYPVARLNMVSFITAANVCDELVTLAAGGSERRYRWDGVISEGDAGDGVISELLASMNAELTDDGGQLSLRCRVSDLASPVIADLSADDVVGGFEWQPKLPLNEHRNIVRGKYVDASSNSLYQTVDYPAVALASPDGIDRIETLDFAGVQSSGQTQRLAKQWLQRLAYSGKFTAEFKARAWGLRIGDPVKWASFAPLGTAFDNKLMRVVERSNPMNGRVRLVLVEESAALYAWAAEDSAPVTAAAPTLYDWTKAPTTAELAAIESGATRNVNRGAWSAASVVYAVGDEVSAAGSSYACVTAHTSSGANGPPGALWTLKAAAGAPGDPGDPGDPGAEGISSRIVFQRAATAPATPSPSAGTPSGWYDTTTAVPAGSNPMWSTTGSTPLGGGNFTWGAAVRVEAISANQTGESTGAFYTTSATLSFVLNPGQSRNVYIQGDVPSPTGSGNVYPQIEYREAGGSWTASNGTTWTYANADPVPAMDLNHEITVSNSGTEARTYEVRGTIVRSNTNSGALTTALSFLRI